MVCGKFLDLGRILCRIRSKPAFGVTDDAIIFTEIDWLARLFLRWIVAK